MARCLRCKAGAEWIEGNPPTDCKRCAELEAQIAEATEDLRLALINMDEDDGKSIMERFCKRYGHEFIDDQCLKPEHRYCIVCRVLETPPQDPTPTGSEES